MNLLFTTILIIAGSAIGTTALVLLLRHFPRIQKYREDAGGDENDYTTILATIYGVLLAFMVLTVWSRFSDAGILVDREASELSNVYRLAGGLPQPQKSELRQLCKDYLTAVTVDEWQTMQHQQSSPRAWDVVDRLWETQYTLQQRGVTDIVLRDHLLSSLVNLTDFRRERLLIARTSLPALLWGVLIFGGLLTVLFSSIFGRGGYAQHAFKAASLASIIALILLAIWLLDHPFLGQVHVTTDAFTEASQVFQQKD